MQLFIGDIEFHLVYLRNFEKRPRFTQDRTTYLWTDVRVEAVVIYNPKATSYQANVATGDPELAEVNPIITSAALRHYLAQPRRQILIRHPNGSTLLQAPLDGFTVDCDNGPRVTVQRIDQPTGERTFEVHLTIECAINECRDPKYLLAHRWKRHLDVDHDYLTTIATEGECVFNLPLLVKNGIHADQFRVWLMHPIPDNFAREKIDVWQETDGYTYRYRTIDRERMFNLGSGCQAVRVEAYKTVWVHKPSLRDFVLNAPRNLFGSLNPFSGSGGGSSPAVGVQIGSNIASGVLSLIPRPTIHVLARAWGNRKASRDDLRRICFGIVSFQTGLAALTAFMLAEDFSIMEDSAGRFVQVDKTVTLSPEAYYAEARMRGAGALDLRSLETVDVFFRNQMDLSGELKFNATGNPSPEGGAIGSTLINIIRQTLAEPCKVPSAPNPDKTFNGNQKQLS